MTCRPRRKREKRARGRTVPEALRIAAGMRLGNPAVDAPPGQDVVRTMSEIHRAFPQAASPAEVVVTGPDATGPRVLAAVAALQGRAAAGGQIREPVTATAAGSRAEGRVLVIDVPLVSIGLNLLSAGPAYGLITLIFQDGRLQGVPDPAALQPIPAAPSCRELAGEDSTWHVHFRMTLVTWGFSYRPGMSSYPCAPGRAAAGIPAAEIKE